jgi:hypothetical protein
MALTIVKPGSARSAATPPNRTIDAVSEMGGRSARTTSPSPTSVTVTDRTAWSMSRSAAVDRPLDRRDHQVIDDAERGHGRGNCPRGGEVRCDARGPGVDLPHTGLGGRGATADDDDLVTARGEARAVTRPMPVPPPTTERGVDGLVWR